MIRVIERYGFSWENGEKKKWKVKYVDWQGKERNYFPDFILNEKYMVECKPENLWKSKDVKSKKESAINFCEEKSLKYKMIDPVMLKKENIKALYESGEIKWTDKYQKKYEEKYG